MKTLTFFKDFLHPNGKKKPFNYKVRSLKEMGINVPHYSEISRRSVSFLFVGRHNYPINFICAYRPIYFIPKRFMMLGAVRSTKFVAAKNLGDPNKMVRLQETFLKFYDHIKDIPFDQLLNDKKFLGYFEQMVTKTPPLICSRPYQLALEVAYSKRKFSKHELLNVFKDKISLESSLGISETAIDSSTLYSVLQTYHMVLNTSFGKSSLIVQTTPISLTRKDMENLPPKVKADIVSNKAKTGNAFPDLHIDGHPYDFKDNASYSKNHISLWDQDQIVKEGVAALLKISDVLVERLTLYQLNKPDLPLNFLTYLEKSHVKLKSILQEPTASPTDKVRAWADYLQKTMHERPSAFTIPIIIPTTDKPFVPDHDLLEETKKVMIPEGRLDVVKTKQAIMGILWKHSIDVRQAVARSTYGVLDATKDESSHDLL